MMALLTDALYKSGREACLSYFQMVTDVQGAFSSCFLAGPAFLSARPKTEFVLPQIPM